MRAKVHVFLKPGVLDVQGKAVESALHGLGWPQVDGVRVGKTIEFDLKDDKLSDPMVAEEHITAFNWASTQEIDDMMALTLRVNDYLSGLFSGVGITLVDFKIEFGRIYENDFSRVILADEISPDSCRLWDTATGEKLDKDRFRRDMGNVIESYTEVARRLGIMKDMPTVIQGGLH